MNEVSNSHNLIAARKIHDRVFFELYTVQFDTTNNSEIPNPTGRIPGEFRGSDCQVELRVESKLVQRSRDDIWLLCARNFPPDYRYKVMRDGARRIGDFLNVCRIALPRRST